MKIAYKNEPTNGIIKMAHALIKFYAKNFTIARHFSTIFAAIKKANKRADVLQPSLQRQIGRRRFT